MNHFKHDNDTFVFIFSEEELMYLKATERLLSSTDDRNDPRGSDFHSKLWQALMAYASLPPSLICYHRSDDSQARTAGFYLKNCAIKTT